jgi:NitT/TauT family transport system substrate-binding protein
MKKNVTAAIIFTVIVLVGFGTWSLIHTSETVRKIPEPISIASPLLEQAEFIYIAENKGFFEKNGLNVTVRDSYPNGVASVAAMTGGVTDLSVSAEYPVVQSLLSKRNITVISTIDQFQTSWITARKDRGISTIADLKGKRIGLPRGVIVEFYLGRFLQLHGMNLTDVTLVDVNASDSAEALLRGDVDAVTYFQPYVYAIQERTGSDGVSWPTQNDQLVYAVVAGRQDWVAQHSDAVSRFLKSLSEAEDYANSHPGETELIVQKRLGASDAYMASIRSDHRYGLSLDQSLLVAMNDEARWAINNNLTTEKSVPDFREHISTEGLSRLQPESVNIR